MVLLEEEKAWNMGEQPTCDGFGRAAFTGRDHNQKLHDAVVDFGTAALDNEDILVPNRDADVNAGLAVAEFLQFTFCWLCAQPLADALNEGWV